jgi:hypothetical protein
VREQAQEQQNAGGAERDAERQLVATRVHRRGRGSSSRRLQNRKCSAAEFSFGCVVVKLKGGCRSRVVENREKCTE